MLFALDEHTELWKLANAVTGFAVVQALAFAYALGKDLCGLQSAPRRVKVVLCVAIVGASLLYCCAVYRCWGLADSLRSNDVWRQVTYGRLVAIGMFAVVSIFGLFAKDIFKSSPPK